MLYKHLWFPFFFKSPKNYWHRVQILQASKRIWKCSSGHTLSFCPIWWNIVSRTCFWRNLSLGFLQWSSLQREVKGAANFVSSGSKIFKRLPRQKYVPVFIEITIGLVFGPSTALYRLMKGLVLILVLSDCQLGLLHPLDQSPLYNLGGAMPALATRYLYNIKERYVFFKTAMRFDMWTTTCQPRFVSWCVFATKRIKKVMWCY